MNNEENQTKEKLEWQVPLLIDLNAKETQSGDNGVNDGASTSSNVS